MAHRSTSQTGRGTSAGANPNRIPDDGTRQLLQWGGSIVGTGIVAGVLLMTVLGGFSRTGASTNTGWFALIVVLGCVPFGGMLLTLGAAKWLRNRNGSGR
jgi:di/tricarboxylate transporter